MLEGRYQQPLSTVHYASFEFDGSYCEPDPLRVCVIELGERDLQTQMADDDDEEETNSSFYKIHHNPALNYIYDDIILMNIRHDL